MDDTKRKILLWGGGAVVLLALFTAFRNRQSSNAYIPPVTSTTPIADGGTSGADTSAYLSEFASQIGEGLSTLAESQKDQSAALAEIFQKSLESNQAWTQNALQQLTAGFQQQLSTYDPSKIFGNLQGSFQSSFDALQQQISQQSQALAAFNAQAQAPKNAGTATVSTPAPSQQGTIVQYPSTSNPGYNQAAQQNQLAVFQQIANNGGFSTPIINATPQNTRPVVSTNPGPQYSNQPVVSATVVSVTDKNGNVKKYA